MSKYVLTTLGFVMSTVPALAAEDERYSQPVLAAVQISTDIAYGELTSHRLDAYLPEGDSEVNRPAVLLIHGGAFAAGDKQQDLYAEMATEFALRGYVAFSMNYRLANPGTNPSIPDAADADAGAALNWIRANRDRFGLDPARIALGQVHPNPFNAETTIRFDLPDGDA